MLIMLFVFISEEQSMVIIFIFLLTGGTSVILSMRTVERRRYLCGSERSALAH